MAGTCQVDFYVLQDAGQSAEMLACRLAMMAWEHGNRILVLTENDTAMRRMDELMWNHPRERMLPHSACLPASGAGAAHAVSAPVEIGTREHLDQANADIVINLTSIAVHEPARFQRLLELVPANETQRMASREKFREYRANGLEPSTHPINKT